jgi:hypothetical protein
VELGRWAVAGAREKKKKGLPAWALAGWARRKREREREREREGFCLFFSFFKSLSNSFFKHSNSNQTKIHAYKS